MNWGKWTRLDRPSGHAQRKAKNNTHTHKISLKLGYKAKQKSQQDWLSRRTLAKHQVFDLKKTCIACCRTCKQLLELLFTKNKTKHARLHHLGIADHKGCWWYLGFRCCSKVRGFWLGKNWNTMRHSNPLGVKKNLPLDPPLSFLLDLKGSKHLIQDGRKPQTSQNDMDNLQTLLKKFFTEALPKRSRRKVKAVKNCLTSPSTWPTTSKNALSWVEKIVISISKSQCTWDRNLATSTATLSLWPALLDALEHVRICLVFLVGLNHERQLGSYLSR